MLETLQSWLETPLNWLLLGLGFGFVIFWHELGHFLAAKYVGIKVEQFAVGFGQAVVSFRKGLGVTAGSTARKLQHVIAQERAKADAPIEVSSVGELKQPQGETDDQICQRLGISDTEYRLNWIPLGGYVKMLGQDDMKPGAQADDPRAYNRKSVGARMLVVCAGVVMNIILAAIGFMIVFLVGFNSPPAVVGAVMPGSPAQAAGLKPGDRILTLDGTVQHDWTKVQLNTALADPSRVTPLTYRSPDGTVVESNVTAAKGGKADTDFLMLGVAQPYELRGPTLAKWRKRDQAAFDQLADAQKVIRPGDVVTAVNGRAVGVKDIATFDAALQASAGKPVELAITDAYGTQRVERVQPVFAAPFGGEPLGLLGMQMLPKLTLVGEDSAAFGKLLAGDVVVGINDGNDRVANPSVERFRTFIGTASANGRKVNVDVLRDGKPMSFADLDPTRKLKTGGRGLNVEMDRAWDVPIAADPIAKSSADGAVPSGLRLATVNGRPVTNWFDVREALRELTAGQPVAITGTLGEKPHEVTLKPTKDEVTAVASMLYTHPNLVFGEMDEPRKTSNPLTAAAWGVGETRDAVLQVYLTVQRMIGGSVSYKNVSGPVGIFSAGYKFADRGTVWLMWFLSIISANLAVMNFLPIPIVDGGLFTFLVIEKIKGKPVSPKVQAVAQVVGLAILLSVFLLATYQDISRLFS